MGQANVRFVAKRLFFPGLAGSESEPAGVPQAVVSSSVAETPRLEGEAPIWSLHRGLQSLSLHLEKLHRGHSLRFSL